MNLPALTRALLLVAVCLTALPAEAEPKRVAIVYSETSRQGYWDEFAYHQLYMAAQYQCAQAGIHYDLLDEDDLTSAASLAPDAVLVAPLIDSVTAVRWARIVTALNEAVSSGLNIPTKTGRGRTPRDLRVQRAREQFEQSKGGRSS